MSRLVFLTCHLTGTGHLVRTLTLARTAQRLGHEAVVITGGRMVPHIDLSGLSVVQLDPIFVKRFEFHNLRDANGGPATEAYMASRRAALERNISELAPDALITELYPFGRRVLAEEFLAGIIAARTVNPKVAVISSIRDIPEPKPKRLTETATHLLKKYHGVLVHGDADFLPLWTTWPLPDDVAPLIHHVGYVGGGVSHPEPERRRGDVLVSVGGGALGRQTLAAAAEAAGLSDRPWHLLVGGSDAKDAVAELKTRFARPNLTIEPTRSDYRDLLTGAGCSVSLCGYNTAVELLARQTPALLVPSEEADEMEQTIRARRLSALPGLSVLPMDQVTPDALANHAERLASGPARPASPLPGDDGDAAIRVVEDIIARRRD
ncbi:MAG: glycosyltransferase [Pseudomonadota bacterium]